MLVEWCNLPVLKEPKEQFKFAISENLFADVFCLSHVAEPATNLLFEPDDCKGGLGSRQGPKSFDQVIGTFTLRELQNGHVIGVEDDHALASRLSPGWLPPGLSTALLSP